ncbi:MAG: hypothetical protein LBH79_05265 [Nitrososphaerota archaeon]|nr:hypothetical protein [Nitrososphaerota archaeon]
MSWINWTLLGGFIGGFLLFLYGANYYNAVAGYSGVFLSIGSIATWLIIFAYKELKKPPAPPENVDYNIHIDTNNNTQQTSAVQSSD